MSTKLTTFSRASLASSNVAQQVASSAIAVASLTIQAESTNTGSIFIGDSTVTTTSGIEVGPGDCAVLEGPLGPRGPEEFLISEVYIVGANAGDKVRLSAFRRRN